MPKLVADITDTLKAAQSRIATLEAALMEAADEITNIVYGVEFLTTINEPKEPLKNYSAGLNTTNFANKYHATAKGENNETK